MKKVTLLMACVLIATFSANANNIQINNLSITEQNYLQRYCIVEFDLSWENSWRNESTPPFNRDAAWVFIKFKNLSGEWHHATLSSDGHIGPESATITGSDDNKGVFIYRSSAGNGNVSYTDIRLKWNYGNDEVSDDGSIEIAVYAIEMVYVPEGDFKLGDGNAVSYGSAGFISASDPFKSVLISSGYTVVQLRSLQNCDNIYMWYTSDGIGIDGDQGIDTIPLDNNFDNPYYPTGYKAFYCMKYEISQEQYRDFLNSLTRAQQNNRVRTDISGSSTDTVYVMSNTLQPLWNQSICIENNFSYNQPVTFYCELNKVSYSPPSFDPDSIDDGQSYACNFLSWMDAAAYADWAGLRPMTELEFEKACRGSNPSVPYEYAWGDPNISYVGAFTFNYAHQGYPDQTITNISENTGNANWGFIHMGPLRNGIFAASSPNHLKCEAGSSYYGIMEMSGNLHEMLVHAGNNAGLSYTGIHGNGELNTSGEADVDFWPGIGGNNNFAVPNTAYDDVGVTGYGGAGNRGGSFEGNQELRVSDRSQAGCAYSAGIRGSEAGFRAVRSAPVD